MVQTRRMKISEASPKSVRSDKIKKIHTKNKCKSNNKHEEKVQSKKIKRNLINRTIRPSIDELLELCRPLTVRLTRCDEMLKKSSKL